MTKRIKIAIIEKNAVRRLIVITNITFRIDEDVKRDAEILFDKLGFTISGAINVYFRQAIREQAIPFKIKAVPPPIQASEDKNKNIPKEYNTKHLFQSVEQAKAGRMVVVKALAELEAMEND